MNKYKAIIFDLDGTLLDTCEGVLTSVKDTIKHFGFRELSQEELMTFNGPPMKRSLIKHFNLDNDKADEATEYFREQYRTVNLFKAKRYDNCEECLCFLKDKGYKLGVATYKRTDYAIGILEHFGLAKYFDLIMGDTVGSKRTKADIIKLVSETLCPNPSEVVMIGDMESDFEGAKKASVDFIGLTFGYGFKNACQVDFPLFDNYKELTDYFLAT